MPEAEADVKSKKNILYWNYEVDLELLRTKLSQGSVSVEDKERIRDFMERTVYGDVPQTQIEPLIPEVCVINGAMAMEPVDLVPGLTSSIIREMNSRILQFQKHYQSLERDKKRRTGVTQANSLSGQLQTENCNQSGSNEEVSWEDLQKAWTVFERFFKADLKESKQDKNPLEIDLIIRNIVPYLPRRDLLSCRLINTTWNDEAVSHYFKKPKANFRKTPCINNLKSFCEDIKLLRVPTIFKRIYISLTEGTLLDCFVFCEMLGAHIKDLRIGPGELEMENTLSSRLEYKLKLRTILQGIPYLKTLRLFNLPQAIISDSFVFTANELSTTTLKHVKKLSLSFEDSVSPEFIEGIFSLVPNVKTVFFFWSEDQDFAPVSASLRKLKFLDSLYDGGDVIPVQDFWSKLKSRPLRRLQIEVKPEIYEDLLAYKTFFESQAETITHLHLSVNNEEYWGNERIALPVMKTLYYLDLINKNNDISLSRFEPYQFPNLAKICLRDLETFEDLGWKGKFQSVSNLSFWGRKEVKNCSSSAVWEYIGSVFPNLRQLRNECIHMSDVALAAVFKYSNLECLCLNIYDTNLRENYNFTLCGLPVAGSWITSQLLSMHTQSTASIDLSGHPLRNITRLKQLVLHFKSSFQGRHENGFIIDEFCLHFGFLALPRLPRLALYGDFTISEEGASELSKYHANVVLSPASRN